MNHDEITLSVEGPEEHENNTQFFSQDPISQWYAYTS
jgi:hypothetical protein